MKWLKCGLLVAGLVLPSPAVASESENARGCDSEREGSCNENGGKDCQWANGHCEDNDFSPNFDDSPVEDSFNPVVCLPFSSCSFNPKE